jgi:RpiR family carbohydrate utilization transcriptional regulator
LQASRAASAKQNILEVVGAALGQLRKSDRKVAEAVLADPVKILHSTVAQTAEIAGVSQPTVIRFCTSIKCEGFQDFKLRLARSLALGTSATHSVIANTDTTTEVASKIFDYTMTSLDWARHHLDLQSLEDAVDRLAAASRIEFFGFGASGVVAQDAQQKFPLFGVPCGAENDTHQQVMIASILRSGDVAVVISNTGATRSLIEVARLVKSRGCTVIGLLGTRGPLALDCDVTIVVETLDNTNVFTPTISRIAMLALVDILSTAVALRRGIDHENDFLHMKRRLSKFRTGGHF